MGAVVPGRTVISQCLLHISHVFADSMALIRQRTRMSPLPPSLTQQYVMTLRQRLTRSASNPFGHLARHASVVRRVHGAHTQTHGLHTPLGLDYLVTSYNAVKAEHSAGLFAAPVLPGPRSTPTAPQFVCALSLRVRMSCI